MTCQSHMNICYCIRSYRHTVTYYSLDPKLITFTSSRSLVLLRRPPPLHLHIFWPLHRSYLRETLPLNRPALVSAVVLTVNLLCHIFFPPIQLPFLHCWNRKKFNIPGLYDPTNRSNDHLHSSCLL
uniref:Uncharacterized protein n=1 Tax=Hordeum vulgare subsp. vulgare TaxID=112509 RepID=M0YVV1_HORVV